VALYQVSYVVISLPVIGHNSFVLGTFCLHDFVERKYFSAEQSYSAIKQLRYTQN